MKKLKNYTEAEVLEIISRVCNKLAKTYKFGYHELEDMKQEATVIALEGLVAYDEIRPLENFLWIVVRNGLYNFKRKHYARLDKPCHKCPFDAYVNGECTKHVNLLACEPYAKWDGRNEVKKNLMSTKMPTDQVEATIDSLDDALLAKELYGLVDANLPVDMREDWIRFSNKLKLSKPKREALLAIIREILEANGIRP